jgi:site-specific recombinase XerD
MPESYHFLMISTISCEEPIPIGPKRKVGMHSLRHTLASALLEQEIPLAVISDVLGHLEPDSTGVYLKTGIAGLRECALTPPGGTV